MSYVCACGHSIGLHSNPHGSCEEPGCDCTTFNFDGKAPMVNHQIGTCPVCGAQVGSADAARHATWHMEHD